MQNAPQELFFLVSPNLLTARSPEEITWELAPEGDHGILPPGGNSPPKVFEEAHILPLKSGGFWVVGRTSQGYLGAASTRDPTARRGWSRTGYATYWDNRAPQHPPKTELKRPDLIKPQVTI